MNVCLSAFGQARMDFGVSLKHGTDEMLSEEGMERYKSVEVDAMIERVCNVVSINFPPLSLWAMDSHVKRVLEVWLRD